MFLTLTHRAQGAKGACTVQDFFAGRFSAADWCTPALEAFGPTVATSRLQLGWGFGVLSYPLPLGFAWGNFCDIQDELGLQRSLPRTALGKSFLTGNAWQALSRIQETQLLCVRARWA